MQWSMLVLAGLTIFKVTTVSAIDFEPVTTRTVPDETTVLELLPSTQSDEIVSTTATKTTTLPLWIKHMTRLPSSIKATITIDGATTATMVHPSAAATPEETTVLDLLPSTQSDDIVFTAAKSTTTADEDSTGVTSKPSIATTQEETTVLDLLPSTQSDEIVSTATKSTTTADGDNAAATGKPSIAATPEETTVLDLLPSMQSDEIVSTATKLTTRAEGDNASATGKSSIAATPEETTVLDLLPSTQNDEIVSTATTKTTTLQPWVVHTKRTTRLPSSITATTTTDRATTTTTGKPSAATVSNVVSSSESFTFSTMSVTSIDVPFVRPAGTFEHGEYHAACMDELFSITCPSEHMIVITEAQYGLFDGSPCKPSSHIGLCTIQMTRDIVNTACSGRSMCSFEVSLETFLHCDDPGSVLYVKHVCVSAGNIFDVCDISPLPVGEAFVTSPGYPDQYSPALDCFQTLDPGPLNSVMLSIHDVSLTAKIRQDGCEDYLRITEPGNAVHNYCGDMSTYGLQLEVILNRFDLEFYSDDMKDLGKRGFMLSYQVIPKDIITPTPSTSTRNQPTTVSEFTTSMSGSDDLVNKGFDCTTNHNNNDNEMCSLSCEGTPFNLQCPVESVIVISEAKFGTLPSYSSSCNVSTLTSPVCTPQDIYYPAVEACSGLSYCVFDIGRYNPSCNNTTNVQVMIKYKCIQKSAMIDVCGSQRFPSEGFIISPNYPATPNEFRNCDRKLIPSSNESVITYELIDLDMHMQGFCYDRVGLYDAIDNDQQMIYCGKLEDNTKPVSQNYSSLAIQYVHIFGTDAQVRGFMLHYKLTNVDSDTDAYIFTDVSTTPVATTSTEPATTTTVLTTTQPTTTLSTTTLPTTKTILPTTTPPITTTILPTTTPPITTTILPTTTLPITTTMLPTTTLPIATTILPTTTLPPSTESPTTLPTTTLPTTTTTLLPTTPEVTLLSTTPPFGPKTAVTKMSLCYGQTKTISCDSTDDIILIKSALYGKYTENQCGDSVTVTQTCDTDIVQDVSFTCTGYNNCIYTMDDSNFPEEKCGASSVLVIKFTCVTKPVDICSSSTPLSMPEGFVSSQNYPAPYDYNRQSCTKTISPSTTGNATIITRIYDMDVEKRASGPGCHDTLILEEYQNPIKYYPYCGDLLTSEYQLQQQFDNLTISFRADSSVHGKGFLLYYRVIGDVPQTTQEVTSTSQKITTPSVPESSVPESSIPVSSVHQQQSTTTTTETPEETSVSTSSMSAQPTTVTTPSTSTTTAIPIAPDTKIVSTTLCFDERQMLSCDEDSEIILIESAKYGVFTENQCAGNASITGSCDLDIVQEVTTQCSGFKECVIVVNNLTFPHTKCSRDNSALVIHHRCYTGPSDICSSETLPMPEGLVASTNYPQHYTYDKSMCTKTIQPHSSNASVLVRIYDLDVEARTHQRGCYDVLYLKDYQEPWNSFEYCGNVLTSENSLQQTFSNLTISFQPDASNHGKGFLIFYKVIGDMHVTTTPATLSTTDALENTSPSTTTATSTTLSTTSDTPRTTSTMSSTATSTVPTTTTTTTTASTTNTTTSATATSSTMDSSTTEAPLTPATSAYSISVCLGESMSFSCPAPSSVLLIESASFGLYTENQCGRNVSITGTCDTDIIVQVIKKCTGHKECVFMVDDTNFPSDKCDTSSVLAITYRCYSELDDICSSGSLHYSEGLVSSTNYPGPYSYDEDQGSCTKTIEPYTTNATIVTRLYDLDLETDGTNLGCSDKLTLQDTEQAGHGFEYCGTMLSPTGPLQTEFSGLDITFQPNLANHGKGFLLYYKVFDDIVPPSTAPMTTSTTSIPPTSHEVSSAKSTEPTTTTSDTVTTTTVTEQHTSPVIHSTTTMSAATSTSSPATTGSSSSSTTTSALGPSTSRDTGDVTTNTTGVVMDTTTETTNRTAAAPPPVTEASKKAEVTYAWVAGVVLGILFIIVLIVIVALLLVRDYHKPKKTVLKPGQRDLMANTHGAHVNAMNEYTYMDMQNPSHYDSFLSLAAHESALSNPVYDANSNRNYSQPVGEERVVVVNGNNSAGYRDPQGEGHGKNHENGKPVQQGGTTTPPKQIRLEDVFPPIHQETSLSEEKSSKMDQKDTVNNSAVLNISDEALNDPDGVSEAGSVGKVQTNELSDIRIIELDSSKRKPDGSNVTLEDAFPASFETFSSA